MGTKGMSSLNEDDVRRVVDGRLITAFVALSTNVGRDQFLPDQLRGDLARLIWNTAMLIKQPASDKELFEPNRSTEAFYPDNILNTKPPATDT